MYILYLDESGSPDDPTDRFFVLGGAAIFERQTYYIAQDLDRIQTQHFAGQPPVEFHASKIRSGDGFWRRVAQDTRTTVLGQLQESILRPPEPGLVLFAAAVEKNRELFDEEAVKRATELICRAFDIFLMRRYNEANDPQRGLIVFAEGRFHQRSRVWVKGFRELGTKWGVLVNLSDIPYFASTKETRLLQLADYVAHATFLLYERRNPELIRGIIERFDKKDGVLHGLVHEPRPVGCTCPNCHSRRIPGNNGPWLQPAPL